MAPTYATATEFRSYNDLTVKDISTTTVESMLEQAEKQIKREIYTIVRDEPITPDANGYFFLRKGYIADASLNSSIGVDDVTIKEYSSAYDILTNVSSSNASTIDGYNNYFTMDSTYSANTNLYATYYIIAKPHSEVIDFDLKEACIFYATYLAFRKIKTKRLKGGIVSFQLGKMQVTRTEEEYDKMVQLWLDRYNEIKDRVRAFDYRYFATGRATTVKQRDQWASFRSRHPNIWR